MSELHTNPKGESCNNGGASKQEEQISPNLENQKSSTYFVFRFLYVVNFSKYRVLECRRFYISGFVTQPSGERDFIFD